MFEKLFYFNFGIAVYALLVFCENFTLNIRTQVNSFYLRALQ